MHMIHYPKKYEDNGVEEYLYKKELHKKQEIKRMEYEELKQYDSPLIIHMSSDRSIPFINYYKNNSLDMSTYYYSAVGTQNKSKYNIYIFVCYDIGGIDILTGENVTRGYYLYFTYDYTRKKICRKLLLVKASKRSTKDFEKALYIAKNCAFQIVNNYYSNMIIDWVHPNKTTQFMKSIYMEDNINNLRRFRTISNCIIYY